MLNAAGASQQIEYRSLPDLIRTGSEALTRGNYPLAAEALNAVHRNYQEEPLWLNSDLPSKVLPLAGFASFKSSLHDEAIDALQSYLQDHAEGEANILFARYTLASSLLLAGQTEPAREAFRSLRAAAGNTAFRDLALLQEASLSETPQAIALLQELLENPNSIRLAQYARLRLISLAYESGDLALCRHHVLDADWPDSQMPEAATLSFLAAKIAADLESSDPGSALRAYQSVQSKQQLIRSQTARIAALRETYRQISPTLETHQQHWKEQLQESLSLLEQQLQHLKDTPEYYEAITLRKARCFVRINRPLEAWILQESIAQSPSPLARDAHLDWIATAREMNAWQAAANIASAFVEEYPNDPDIAQPLFWIALSQIEQESYSSAIQSLQKVQTRTQDPLTLASTHYYIGYCHYMAGHTQSAHAAFQDCIALDASTSLSGQALLWTGICQFSDNQLETALATFRSIQANPTYSFLHAEAEFREIATQYAAGELDNAKELCSAWLARYPLHARRAETQTLLGDIHNELGEAPLAIATYRAVDTADFGLAFHAAEQLTQLLTAQGDSASALTYLEQFEQKHPIPPTHAGPFLQLKLPALDETTARAHIKDTLKIFGDNPAAVGLVELILLLPERKAPTQASPTLLSRFLLSEIITLRKDGQLTQAKILSLRLVSDFDKRELPASALLEAGLALQEIQSQEASGYFQYLLDQYPNSPYRDHAYLGLAQHYTQQGQPSLALAYLANLHRASDKSLALKLKLEIQLGQLSKATETAHQILSNRQTPSATKAYALNSLGRVTAQSGELRDAYAYHQRVFTLYRAEVEEVALAYSRCIHILTTENRESEALALADEFIGQVDLKHLPTYQQAKDWLEGFQNPPQTHAL